MKGRRERKALLEKNRRRPQSRQPFGALKSRLGEGRELGHLFERGGGERDCRAKIFSGGGGEVLLDESLSQKERAKKSNALPAKKKAGPQRRDRHERKRKRGISGIFQFAGGRGGKEDCAPRPKREKRRPRGKECG